MKFNELDVPIQWKDEFTKYPHGYSIFEALCKWVTQVNDMVTCINNLLTTSLYKPLLNTLQEMANSGELGALIQEIIVIDGGEF
ncbi:MAG: hypothetical protein GX160_03160 [Clostridiales bacterium]|nr:hypothetical protein [Clostridiales bacterium]